MGICVSIHAAGNCRATGNRACFFYDGHCHPFLRLRDGTHPLAIGPVNPGLLHRPGRSDRQRRGCRKPGARPTDRLAGQPVRRQPNRRSGRDPGSDPTPVSSQNRGSRAGNTIHSLPAEYFRWRSGFYSQTLCTQMFRFCTVPVIGGRSHRAKMRTLVGRQKSSRPA